MGTSICGVSYRKELRGANENAGGVAFPALFLGISL